MKLFKTLLKCVREYKLPSILSPLFVTVEVIMEVIIPLYMGKLLDNGINGNGGQGDMNYVLKCGVLLVLFCAVSLLSGVLAGKYAAKASTGFSKNLRHDMFYNLQSFSFSNIDRFSVSSLVTRMTTDVANVQNAYQMCIRIAIRAPLMFIFSLAMSIRISTKMSLIFLCIIPFLAVLLFAIVSKAHPLFEKVFKIYDKLNRVVSENLSAIRVVKSFVREEREEKKFKDVSGEIYSTFIKAEKLVALNSPIMQFSAYTAMILISWFGSKLIVSSNATELTTGDLFTLISYGMQILMTLMMLSMIIVMITMSRASAKRISEVLNEKSDLSSGEKAVKEVKDGSIEFNNVDFSYANDSDKLCLTGVNLKINSGETIGILGSTGSSKSTLVQLIPRLYDVTGGCVKVGGTDVRDYDLDALREDVAMVLQKNVLFSGTIKENLRWGNENATDEEIINACKISQADEFISKFPDGYDTYVEQGGTNLSGGQKQRICIARSLLKKPKILILDDSTSAVDTKTDAMIRNAFEQIIPETTKIIIAQRISSVENADKVIILDGGRVDAFDTPENLLKTNNIYKEVYNSQVKGVESNG